MSKSHAASKSSERVAAVARPAPRFPEQKLEKPGLEKDLTPPPQFEGRSYKPAGKLAGMVALVTGGDSGIGRAVAVLFAREGADVAINYLPEEQVDADETKRCIEQTGQECLQLPADLRQREACEQLVRDTVGKWGKLDILVSNAAHQNRKSKLEEVSDEEWSDTFRTNVDAMFYLCRAALPHIPPGGSIIVTSSVTGMFGSKKLLDYSATKGAINAFVKALAQNVLDRGIRVNAVAPGPVWTPLNAADEGQSAEDVAKFGENTPIGRPAQPDEVAPAFVFLASSADSSYITGHVLPLLGGETAN